MVYKNNVVVALKVHGKILGEDGDLVTLPFGTEYTILVKNLNSKKAVVKIDIDGEDVLDGDGLIVLPNSDIELEGFKKKNKVTNRFKFIKKTDKISEHRGDRIDDGIIRVEASFEKKVRAYDMNTVVEKHYHYPYYYYLNYLNCDFGQWSYTANSGTYNSGLSAEVSCNFSNIPAAKIYSGTVSANDIAEDSVEDNGITVKGNDDSKQSFIRGNINTLEKESSVIILRLRGMDSKEQKVKEPIFTKTKNKCETCGKVSRFSAKFCATCGTCLK